MARPADLGETNPVRQLTATRIPNISPPKYQAQWDATREKGKWYFQAEFPYKSNIANFKVDKRSQIVQVANSWVGYEISSNTNCFSLVEYIYDYVGLPLGTVIGGADLWAASDDNPTKDSLPGAILFYRSPGALAATWTNAKTVANGNIASHAALRVTGGMVDTNCGTPNYADPFETHKHTDENDPLGGNEVPGNPGRTPRNPALDIRDRTPSILTELDDE